MDTDEKKQECFLKGLHEELAYDLEARDFANFQALVDKALLLESRKAAINRKRKMGHHGQQGGSSSKPRFNAPPTGYMNRPVQPQQQQQQQQQQQMMM